MAWSVLSSRRIAGIIRRHLYLLRRSWPRLFLLGALVFLLSSRSARGQDVLLQVGE